MEEHRKWDLCPWTCCPNACWESSQHTCLMCLQSHDHHSPIIWYLNQLDDNTQDYFSLITSSCLSEDVCDVSLLVASHCLLEAGTTQTQSSGTSGWAWRPERGLGTDRTDPWTLGSGYTSVWPSAPDNRPPASTSSSSRVTENRRRERKMRIMCNSDHSA